MMRLLPAPPPGCPLPMVVDRRAPNSILRLLMDDAGHELAEPYVLDLGGSGALALLDAEATFASLVDGTTETVWMGLYDGDDGTLVFGTRVSVAGPEFALGPDFLGVW